MKKIIYTFILLFAGIHTALSQAGLDPSFGSGGLVTTNFGFGETVDQGNAIAIQPDGKIILAGGGDSYSKLVRYNPDGTLDINFGEAGKVSMQIDPTSSSEKITDIKLSTDGGILVAGTGIKNSGGTPVYYYFVAKLLADGSPDAGFATAVNYLAQNEYVFSSNIGLQSNGKIIWTANGIWSQQAGTLITKRSSDGSPDPVNGMNLSVLDPSLTVNDLVVLPNNDFLLCGSGSNNFALAKYSTESLTKQGNTMYTDFYSGSDYASAMALQPDGKIILAGSARNTNLDYDFAIARYKPDGTLDESFGINGKLVTDFGGMLDAASDIIIQPDGKIVLAGKKEVHDDTVFAAARYLENGQLDPCFGQGGKLLIDFPRSWATSAALQPDGKIILAGFSYLDFALARYIAPTPTTWYKDFDGDGYGDDANTKLSCPQPYEVVKLDPNCVDLPPFVLCPTRIIFWVSRGGDCNDSAAAIHPDAPEICDGKDNNCDGVVDEGVAPPTWYLDADRDGFGNDNSTIVSCSDPSTPDVQIAGIVFPGLKFITVGGDCNDNNVTVHPGAIEVCDGMDNDCDGETDEGLPTTTYYTDADGDGYGAGTGKEFCNNPGTGYATNAGDCNDNDPGVHPGAAGSIELCDGIDNDCDGLIDEDCSGKPTISISDITVYESEGKAVLTIRLSYITSLQVKINYATSDGTALSNKKEKDYKATGNTMLTIPPGTLSTTITIPVYNDGKTENNEYFFVNLSKPTNCMLGDVTGMVTIKDGSTSLGTNMVTSRAASELPAKQFDVKAYPNPSSLTFTLRIESNDYSAADIKITNSLGQLVKSIHSTNHTIRFGQELKAGVYVVEIAQGINRKTIKVIKF